MNGFPKLLNEDIYIVAPPVSPILDSIVVQLIFFVVWYNLSLWRVNNGWIDYCVPQIYWEIGNKAADYQTLIQWWNRFAGARPLFIGENIERTVKAADLKNPNVNQMPAKYALHQQMSNVEGTVLWYAKAAVDDMGRYGSVLQEQYWKAPALQPRMPFIDGKAPKNPRKVTPVWTNDGYILFWQAPKGSDWKDKAEKYVIYRFAPGQKVNLNDASCIVEITGNEFYKLPYTDGRNKYTYVVTALDRMSNESKGVKKKIKLWNRHGIRMCGAGITIITRTT